MPLSLSSSSSWSSPISRGQNINSNTTTTTNNNRRQQQRRIIGCTNSKSIIRILMGLVIVVLMIQIILVTHLSRQGAGHDHEYYPYNETTTTRTENNHHHLVLPFLSHHKQKMNSNNNKNSPPLPPPQLPQQQQQQQQQQFPLWSDKQRKEQVMLNILQQQEQQQQQHNEKQKLPPLPLLHDAFMVDLEHEQEQEQLQADELPPQRQEGGGRGVGGGFAALLRNRFQKNNRDSGGGGPLLVPALPILNSQSQKHQKEEKKKENPSKRQRRHVTSSNNHPRWKHPLIQQPLILPPGTPIVVLGLPDPTVMTSILEYMECTGIITNTNNKNQTQQQAQQLPSKSKNRNWGACMLQNLASSRPILQDCSRYGDGDDTSSSAAVQEVVVVAPLHYPRKMTTMIQGRQGILLDNGTYDFSLSGGGGGGGIGAPPRIFLPQHYHLQKIHDYSPNATWIIPQRSTVEEWIQAILFSEEDDDSNNNDDDDKISSSQEQEQVLSPSLLALQLVNEFIAQRKTSTTMNRSSSSYFYKNDRTKDVSFDQLQEIQNLLKELYQEHIQIIQDFIQSHPPTTQQQDHHLVIHIDPASSKTSNQLSHALFGIPATSTTNTINNNNNKGEEADAPDACWNPPPIIGNQSEQNENIRAAPLLSDHIHIDNPNTPQVGRGGEEEGNTSTNTTSRTTTGNSTTAIISRSKQLVVGSNTCSDLFGYNSTTRTDNGACLTHPVIHWMSCQIGTLYVNTTKIKGSVGGEPLETVWNRPASEEDLIFEQGALQIRTIPSFFKYFYQKSGWTGSMDHVITTAAADIGAHVVEKDKDDETLLMVQPSTSARTNLLVRRGDYANPCMTVATMYNVYLVLQQFNIESPYRIIWLDGHAQGVLDLVWERLFDGGKVLHIKQLSPSEQHLENAVLVNVKSAFGDEGMRRHRFGHACDPSSSTLEDFRNFVLNRYGIVYSNDNSDDSSDKKKKKILTLLVRKHHRAHPRATGQTDRTLANVTEDVHYLQSQYPNHIINVVSFENMSFDDQLKHITRTDVFVAVHGAGNIHVLFLPRHATFVEYVPPGFFHRERFKFLSQCLNITYIRQEAIIVDRHLDKTITVQLWNNNDGNQNYNDTNDSKIVDGLYSSSTKQIVPNDFKAFLSNNGNVNSGQ